MIIGCPECSVKFMIENDQFGEKPRKVRCGKCEHVWEQEPPSQEDVAELKQVKAEQAENLAKIVTDKRNGVKPNLPTVIKSSKFKRLLKVACWLLFVANVLVFILLNKPLIGQTEFYDLIGDYDSAGVKISSVKFKEPFEEDGKNNYFFDWQVKNDRQNPMRVPHAKMALLDADRNVIFETKPTSVGESLAKDGSFSFASNKLVDESGKGRYVVIDIGNQFEIETRDYN